MGADVDVDFSHGILQLYGITMKCDIQKGVWMNDRYAAEEGASCLFPHVRRR